VYLAFISRRFASRLIRPRVSLSRQDHARGYRSYGRAGLAVRPRFSPRPTKVAESARRGRPTRRALSDSSRLPRFIARVPNGVTDFQRSVAGQAFVAAAYHGDTFPRSSSSKRAIRAQPCGISLARVAARAFLREFPRVSPAICADGAIMKKEEERSRHVSLRVAVRQSRVHYRFNAIADISLVTRRCKLEMGIGNGDRK